MHIVVGAVIGQQQARSERFFSSEVTEGDTAIPRCAAVVTGAGGGQGAAHVGPGGHLA